MCCPLVKYAGFFGVYVSVRPFLNHPSLPHPQVYKCKRRAKKEVFACKVIDKRKLNMEVESKDLLLEQLRKEIEILQHLSHPNIVEFQDVIETADKIFVVMELVQGGELFEYLLDRGPLPEDVAVHIMRQVGRLPMLWGKPQAILTPHRLTSLCAVDHTHIHIHTGDGSYCIYA